MNSKNEAGELAESAAGYAGNLYNGLEEIVAHMRGGDPAGGFSLFNAAIEGIEWLFQAVTLLNGFYGDDAGFDTNAIRGFFAEMIGASENGDYVLFADLIEYEILPIIDEWGNKLDNILAFDKGD